MLQTRGVTVHALPAIDCGQHCHHSSASMLPALEPFLQDLKKELQQVLSLGTGAVLGLIRQLRICRDAESRWLRVPKATLVQSSQALPGSESRSLQGRGCRSGGFCDHVVVTSA